MKSFSELPLDESLMKSIRELGYETPTPIQAQALPILLGEPIDFIGLAATGTGKTAAFGLPLLQKIDREKKGIQGLVLCPTRELAVQVTEQLNILGKYKGIRAVAVYGGSSYGEQIRGIRSGAAIIVGTPGRLTDHLSRENFSLKDVHTVVLDEADEMISMGFKEDLEAILKATSREQSHIWLFSATMDRQVRGVADTYLRSPRHVQVNREEMLSTTVEQIYYVTREGNKREILCKIIDSAEDFYGLVFAQTKQIVSELSQYLAERGYRVDSLHGDKDQHQRERTLAAFKDHKVSILVCTDVASRGLDVKDITHVVNYSIPRELESYVHRIGRTARSGKAGFAMSLVTPSHRDLIPKIERMTKSKMTEGKVPNRKEIGTKKVSELLARFQGQQNYSRAIELMDDNWKKEIAGLSGEAVAGKLLMLAFPHIFEEERKEAPAHSTFTSAPRRGHQGRSPDRRAGGYGRRPPIWQKKGKGATSSKWADRGGGFKHKKQTSAD